MTMGKVVTLLKVLGKSVGFFVLQNYKEKGSIVHQFKLVSVWRIICENFNPNGLILAEI